MFGLNFAVYKLMKVKYVLYFRKYLMVRLLCKILLESCNFFKVILTVLTDIKL